MVRKKDDFSCKASFLSFARKLSYDGGFSRKVAKRCRVSKGFPLRLCAFAWERFLSRVQVFLRLSYRGVAAPQSRNQTFLLCGPLRISARSAVKLPLPPKTAEIRRGHAEKISSEKEESAYLLRRRSPSFAERTVVRYHDAFVRNAKTVGIYHAHRTWIISVV
jgi:hypothetical protein